MFFTRKRLQLYLGALLVLQVLTCIAVIPAVRGGYIDFRTFYTAGYMLRLGQGRQLYDYAVEQHLQSVLVTPDTRALPMLSPPFSALPFAPLSHLSFWPAYFIFAAVNVLLLLTSGILFQPYLDTLRIRWRPAPVLIFLSFLPAGIALLLGQLSMLLLLIYCAAFVALRRGNDLIAGLVLSLALIKFQVALPIAFLFLLWRQWKFIAGFLAGSAFLTALSAWIIGVRNLLPYIHSLYSLSRSITAQASVQLHYGVLPAKMPTLYGLLFIFTGGARWIDIPVVIASLIILIWTAVHRPSLPHALLASILISYHLFLYDLTLVLLPLSLIANQLLRTPHLSAELVQHSRPRAFRLLFTRISAATLLFAPFLRMLIAADRACWLALPVLILLFSNTDWSDLHGTPLTEHISDPSALEAH